VGRSLRGGEELRHQLGVGVHRAADVHHEDDARVGAPRGAGHDLELACVLRRSVDRLLEIELALGALAREGPQLAKGELDLPHVEDDVAAVALVGARVGRLDRASSSGMFAHAQAARVYPLPSERRSASRSDPSVSAVVPLFLLAQALLEKALQLGEIEGLEQRALFVGELGALGGILQPCQELVGDCLGVGVDAAKVGGERYVERVEVCLAVDEDRACEEVEAVERAVVEAHRHGARQGHRLLRADRHLVLAKLVEKLDEHGI
jgi:hypothetical protein